VPLDARVRELVAAGDPAAAATAAIESLGPAILGYLRVLHRDEDDAADVFQRWAEDLWRGIDGFRGDGALRAWGYRLAWHASARFRRDGWRQRRVRLRTSMASRLAGSVARSAPLGRRDERLDVLAKDLAPEDRTLLLLRLDLEMPWEEIAEVLAEDGVDLSPPALRKRFQRLKERLGELAREKGLLG
jgi:RNA polymerase sigma-70 factor (ECF subfamily)